MFNYITCIIPARSNSKGIKNKNIKKIDDKELIQYPYQLAIQSKYINEIIFTSDSFKYINILKKLKIKSKKKIYFLHRSQKLAKDNTSTYDVIFDALKISSKLTNFVVLLEPTSPLTTRRDLDKGISHLIRNKNKFNSVISIISNDKFNSAYKLKINKKNKLEMFGKKVTLRRQEILKEYVPSGNFYISKKKSLLKDKNFINKKTYGYEVNKKYYTDIDDKIDLEIARCLNKI